MLRTLALLLAAQILAVPVVAREITFDDLYSVPRCGAPQVSPDGRTVVFTLTTTDVAANSRETHLWSMASDGSNQKQLTFNPGSESHPRWTPDGTGLLFLADRENGTQVWLLPMDGGEARRVTGSPAGVSEFVCSPDGSELLYVTRVFPDCTDDACNEARLKENRENPDRPRLYDRLFARRYNHWDDRRVNRLFIASIAEGRTYELCNSPFDVPGSHLGGDHDFAWSPGGKRVCFAMSTDSMPAVFVNNELYIKPVCPGDPIRLTDNTGQDGTPRYSPDGRSLAYQSTARAAYESDQADISLRDLTTGEYINLTEHFDLSCGGFVWGAESRYIYFTAIEHGFSKVWRVDVRTQKVELLLGDAVYSNLAVSPDGKFLIVGRSLSESPYELHRFDLASRKLTRLTHFTDPVTTDLDMNRAQEFWFTGTNGDSVHGFLTLPPSFDSNASYPLTLLIHGGPQWCWLGDFNYYGWNTQLLAAQGYVVVQIDPHGSVGYGLAFKEWVSGNWGRGDFEDLMAGVDYLLEQHPFIDSTRMAALGRSYGGFMINWICGHTDRFRCLIGIDGTYNHFSFYGSTDELWFPEWDIKGTPWSNWEEYLRSSPLTYAGNFQTPTMIIHGQLDYRVDISEGLQMFTALQRMSVPSQLLCYPNEGHNVGRLKNLRDVYDHQLRWLARWLEP